MEEENLAGQQVQEGSVNEERESTLPYVAQPETATREFEPAQENDSEIISPAVEPATGTNIQPISADSTPSGENPEEIGDSTADSSKPERPQQVHTTPTVRVHTVHVHRRDVRTHAVETPDQPENSQEEKRSAMADILAKPQKTSSMASLLVDGPEKEPKTAISRPVTKTVVANRPSVVVKKPSALVDVLNHGTPQAGSAPPVAKKVAPAVLSRRATGAVKLPDWQTNIATTFLMTPDMSCTDEDIDLTDPENQDTTGTEMDQISEQTTHCCCNMQHESDVMIQCDCCKKWLHEQCIRLVNTNENDPFICIFCQHEMSRAVKSYVRQKISVLIQIVQKYQADGQTLSWNELLENIRDCQEVLRMVPMFLPTNEDEREQDSYY